MQAFTNTGVNQCGNVNDEQFARKLKTNKAVSNPVRYTTQTMGNKRNIRDETKSIYYELRNLHHLPVKIKVTLVILMVQANY